MKFSELNIGDVFFAVDYVSNAMSQKRIEFTDPEGNLWHRYDKPIFEYRVSKLTLVGKMIPTFFGQVENEENHVVEYTVFDDTAGHTYVLSYMDDEFSPEFYSSEEEANNYRDSEQAKVVR